MKKVTEITLAGHYQIVRHLGGGFGQIFLAKDSHLPGKPLCAVKQFKFRVSDRCHYFGLKMGAGNS